MLKKILKWVVIIWVVTAIFVFFIDDDESKNSSASNKTEQTSEQISKNNLSVSDFKLNKDISTAVKMLKSKGWKPGDGEKGEMSSEYSGGYFSYMNAYGYVKKDGVFEGYYVPFVQVSYNDYDKLAHFRIVINTTIDSTEVKQKQAELNEQENMLFDKIDDGKKKNLSNPYEMMESVNNALSKITPEIQAEFDKIQEQRRILSEETEKKVRESRIKLGTEIEKRCLLQYGYSHFADEDEKGNYTTHILGYKNQNGDICKLQIEDATTFDTIYTLDYVSAQYRAEEKLANELVRDRYGW